MSSPSTPPQPVEPPPTPARTTTRTPAPAAIQPAVPTRTQTSAGPADAGDPGTAFDPADVLRSPTVARVQAALGGPAAAGRIRILDGSARTAAEAAAQLGCPVGAIANSLVFLADDEPVLVLTSGAHRVDLPQAGAVLGVSRLRRADAETVRAITGMAIGGVAPVGHATPLRTIVDVDLGQFRDVWAAAGSPYAVFRTSYDELLRITAGTAAEVAG